MKNIYVGRPSIWDNVICIIVFSQLNYRTCVIRELMYCTLGHKVVSKPSAYACDWQNKKLERILTVHLCNVMPSNIHGSLERLILRFSTVYCWFWPCFLDWQHYNIVLREGRVQLQVCPNISWSLYTSEVPLPKGTPTGVLSASKNRNRLGLLWTRRSLKTLSRGRRISTCNSCGNISTSCFRRWPH